MSVLPESLKIVPVTVVSSEAALVIEYFLVVPSVEINVRAASSATPTAASPSVTVRVVVALPTAVQ